MNRMNSFRAALVVALAVAVSAVMAQRPALAADEEGGVPHYPLVKPERQSWSFAGPFGQYDPQQLQRGLQVYREVCAFCHGLEYVAFRTLADENGPYLTDEQMREVAASYRVVDEDTGELRPGGPPDYFPPSAFPTAPDLSLMAKARGVSDGFPYWITDGLIQYQEAGPNYIYGLLTGYTDPPEGTTVQPGLYYNPHFISGTALSMGPPLSAGRVTYADGTEGTVEQYAEDISAFLMWTAEPHLTERKRLGFQVFVFLLAFGVLVYLTKRTVWKNVKH